MADPEVRASEVLGVALAEIVKAGFSNFKGGANIVVDRVSLDLKAGFTKYQRHLSKRYGKVKTLLYRETPVPISECYIGLHLKNDSLSLSEVDVIKNLEKLSRVVISGSAGTGKSMIMKYILLHNAMWGYKKLPVFIELRSINNSPDVSIKSRVLAAMQAHMRKFSEDLLDFGFKSGSYILLLDGFDEVDNEYKAACERDILDLSNEFSGCPIIVSGRSDERFASWEQFTTLNVQPLSKDNVKTLIGKLRFDKSVKLKFLEAIDHGLYESHKSFLSNPLLATMMLLTYDQFAEIPNKIYLFYKQAFEALFHKHDAIKSLYKRKRNTNISIDIFYRLFSAFCFMTYYEGKVSLPEVGIISYIRKASILEKIDINPEEFLRDLIDCVCIMQHDGLEITYVHRSFQEYFAAEFLNRNQNIDLVAVMDRLQSKGVSGRLLDLLYDINPDFVDSNWGIKKIEKMKDIVSAVDPAVDIFKYMSATSREFTFGINRITYSVDGEFMSFSDVSRIYGFDDDPTNIMFRGFGSNYIEELAIRANAPIKNLKDGVSYSIGKSKEAEKFYLDKGLGMYFVKERKWILDKFREIQLRVSSRVSDLDELLGVSS
jgi:hypothetical protein